MVGWGLSDGIAVNRLLHLDHPRPEVGEQVGGERTGEVAREVDHQDPGERLRAQGSLA